MRRATRIFILLLFATTGIKAQSGIATLADKSAFEEALKNNEKMVVIFAAEWCDYCKAFLPEVEGIVENYKGIRFFKINYDKNIALFQDEGIEMTPTTQLYKNGRKVHDMVVLEVMPLQEKLRDF